MLHLFRPFPHAQLPIDSWLIISLYPMTWLFTNRLTTDKIPRHQKKIFVSLS